MIVTVYSSLLFFVNYLNALYYEYNVYALLFLGLTITSVLHHSSFKNKVEVISNSKIKTIETIKTIDKIFLFSVVLYGGYMLINKIIDLYSYSYSYSETKLELDLDLENITPEKIGLLFVIFSTFFGTIILFFSEKKYCFCSDFDESLSWHAFLHFISSIGHHCIIFL